ncbi:hypothetical protein [Acanthopleuribacter pedis]|uniref:Uncharacterized protein n=1 Tax=Acanthopleuribacter pedis TaxID=442870 RepID=A0A8J7U6E0_9BACT|nr:hypothetical protein [Acanthopleuribacter pedis]MBO1320256.1 hypothetical protein [Acanthopleuribacter pedis]
MKRPTGRPMKYAVIIEQLDEDDLYTPATIADFAEEIGFIDSRDPERHRLERQRVRIAMGRFSNNHKFPDEGDGFVTLRGQPPIPAWFGWRWKNAIHG